MLPPIREPRYIKRILSRRMNQLMILTIPEPSILLDYVKVTAKPPGEKKGKAADRKDPLPMPDIVSYIILRFMPLLKSMVSGLTPQIPRKQYG